MSRASSFGMPAPSYTAVAKSINRSAAIRGCSLMTYLLVVEACMLQAALAPAVGGARELAQRTILRKSCSNIAAQRVSVHVSRSHNIAKRTKQYCGADLHCDESAMLDGAKVRAARTERVYARGSLSSGKSARQPLRTNKRTQRKVRAPKSRMPVNDRAPRGDGKCHRKYTAEARS